MLRKTIFLLIGVVWIFAACTQAPAESTETTPLVEGLAQVDSLEVLYLDTTPQQVQIVACGNLPDACTFLGEAEVEQDGETFSVRIPTTRQADAICAQVVIPFERVIPLDVDGLPVGRYHVDVNGSTTSFEITEEDIAPTQTPVDPSTSSIRGFVWHDLCGIAESAEGIESTTGAGCTEAENGSFIANGIHDDGEPPIEGISVGLTEGNCPRFPSIESITDADGAFSFSGLSAGTYCLFVDPLLSGNREKLMPGRWTNPATDTGWYEIELAATEASEDLGFGWDYDRLPPVNFEGCVDNAQFIQDLTVPDDTVFLPGEVFTKTWLVRNIGTCHWVDGYQLVHAGGDPLSGEPAPLPTVLAGEETEVSVTLLAPDNEGEFRGDWQLENAAGERFGTVGDFDLTFFLKIIVEAQEIDTPAIQGIVWADACDPADGAVEGSGCVEDADGTLIGNGVLDEDELGLEGIWVNLYQGTCATRGDSIDSAVTEVDGSYSLEGLEAGIYCVVVDELAVENIPLLGTGIWTHPALNISTINVTLTAEEIRQDIDFGWFATEE